MKYITTTTLFMGMLLAGCATSVSEIPDASSSPNQAQQETQQTEETTKGRTIMLHSSNWEFSPSTITAKQGENISLHLMGIQGNHGFAIPALGINETMSQGESKLVKIPTDKAGTYEFSCSVPCGSGHRDMKGTIVIEE